MKRFFSETSKIMFVMMCQQDVPGHVGGAYAPSSDSCAPPELPAMASELWCFVGEYYNTCILYFIVVRLCQNFTQNVIIFGQEDEICAEKKVHPFCF